jgi:hypothetical protein
MHTLVESRQTYLFHLQTKEGATPRVVYDYPIEVRAHPDWQEFRQKLAALHADHFTLVVDVDLPKALVEPVYRQVREVGVPCLLIPLRASEKSKLMETVLSVLYQARAHGGDPSAPLRGGRSPAQPAVKILAGRVCADVYLVL